MNDTGVSQPAASPVDDIGGNNMMSGPGYGSGGGAMMIGVIAITVVVAAVLVVGAVWLVRTQRTH
jgi:hypothetical protein